jgi:guanine deaminase
MTKFMKAAIKDARKGIKLGHGGPFGCVIVKDGVIVGKGHNTVVKDKNPTKHGEMNAITNACKNLNTFDLSGCELYTTGEPCPMCLGAILWANISKVYYGCNIDDAAGIGFRDKVFYEFQSKKNEMMVELDRENVLKLFKEYEEIDKVMY